MCGSKPLFQKIEPIWLRGDATSKTSLGEDSPKIEVHPYRPPPPLATAQVTTFDRFPKYLVGITKGVAPSVCSEILKSSDWVAILIVRK